MLGHGDRGGRDLRLPIGLGSLKIPVLFLYVLVFVVPVACKVKTNDKKRRPSFGGGRWRTAAENSLKRSNMGGMTMPNLRTMSPENNLSRYLQEIRRYPMLDREREVELAQQWRDHADTEALDQLIGSHLRLVAKIARSFSGYGLPLADLIAEGNVGLMQAAQKFNPDLGNRFSTYAIWWIRAAIQEYVLRSASIVRMGTTAAQKRLFFNLRRLKAANDELGNGNMSPESVESIAEELGVSADQVTDMDVRLSRGDQSLNAQVQAEGESEWQDLLADESPDQEAMLMDIDEMENRRTLMREAMERLTEREQDIITRRLLQDDRPTLETLAQEYGVSRERIRQIEAAALNKLSKAVLAAAA